MWKQMWIKQHWSHSPNITQPSFESDDFWITSNRHLANVAYKMKYVFMHESRLKYTKKVVLLGKKKQKIVTSILESRWCFRRLSFWITWGHQMWYIECFESFKSYINLKKTLLSIYFAKFSNLSYCEKVDWK